MGNESAAKIEEKITIAPQAESMESEPVAKPTEKALDDDTGATPAPAASTEDGGEDTDASAASDGTDTPARQNKGVGKRINELTREKHDERRAKDEALREAAYWRQMAQAGVTQAKPAQEVANDGKPTLESCNYDIELHADRLSDWKMEQRDRQQQQQRAQASENDRIEAYTTKAAAFAEVHPDYEETIQNAPVQMSNAVLRVIRDSDIAPEIAYHLATHLDTASAIAKLDPLAAAKAIGKLEDKLSASASVPTRPVTRAPAVIKTVNGSASPGKPLGNMEVEDFLNERRAQRQHS